MKHEERKKEIIEAAFKVWGEERFANTSLNALTSALGLTKAAIYRYFQNKEDLLTEMVDAYSSQVSRAFYAFVQEQSEIDPARALKRYINFYFHFYIQQMDLFYFLILHILKGDTTVYPSFSRLKNRQRNFLKEVLGKYSPAWGGEKSRSAVDYLCSTASFFFLYALRSIDKETKKSGQLTEEAVKLIMIKAQKTAEAVVFNGFALAEESPVNFALVEQKCAIPQEELFPFDRLFSPVQEVLSKEGFLEASVGKIADQMGMTKSSLYFFFKNKADIFFQTLKREYDKLIQLIQERVDGFTQFPDKLFAYFITTALYLLENPKILATFNHLRYEQIQFSHEQLELVQLKKEIVFLGKALEEGKLNSHGLGGEELIEFIHFQIIQELTDSALRATSQLDTIRNIRLLYRLFLKGVNNGNKE